MFSQKRYLRTQRFIVLFSFLTLFGFMSACSQSNFQNPADDGSGSTGGTDNGTCEFVFEREDFCAQLIWEKRPNPENNSGSYFLEFSRLDDPSLPTPPTHRLVVTEWMPSMSHPPQTVMADPMGSTGQYFVRDARLYMPGVWAIKVQLVNSSGQVVDEAVYEYNRLQ